MFTLQQRDGAIQEFNSALKQLGRRFRYVGDETELSLCVGILRDRRILWDGTTDLLIKSEAFGIAGQDGTETVGFVSEGGMASKVHGLVGSFDGVGQQADGTTFTGVGLFLTQPLLFSDPIFFDG